MDLRDAVVLITGASGQIGAACARELSGRGCRVILTAPQDTVADLPADIGATSVVCDLAATGAADRLAQDALALYGRVDAVVHSAGIGWRGPTGAMNAERVERLIDVNLRAPLQLSRALLPGMLERGRGHLAFVASIAGWLGVTDEAVYSATKAGLIMYAESLRAELLGSGVGVSVVSPAAVRTDFFANRGSPYDRRIPRQVPAEHVARVIVRGMVEERPHQMVPRWLAVVPAVRGSAPGLFRRMQRRLG